MKEVINMKKFKQWEGFDKILKANGYVPNRVHGSHFIYRNRELGKTIAVNKDLNPMVKRRLIKEYSLEVR